MIWILLGCAEEAVVAEVAPPPTEWTETRIDDLSPTSPPLDAAISPDGARTAWVNRNGVSWHVVGAPAASFTRAPNLRSIAAFRDGWIAGRVGNGLVQISPDGQISDMRVQGSLPGVAPDGRVAFVFGQAVKVGVDPATAAPLFEFPEGETAVRLQWSPDGAFLALGLRTDAAARIVEISGADGSLIGQIDVPGAVLLGEDTSFCWADSKRIVVSWRDVGSAETVISAMDFAGGAHELRRWPDRRVLPSGVGGDRLLVLRGVEQTETWIANFVPGHEIDTEDATPEALAAHGLAVEAGRRCSDDGQVCRSAADLAAVGVESLGFDVRADGAAVLVGRPDNGVYEASLSMEILRGYHPEAIGRVTQVAFGPDGSVFAVGSVRGSYAMELCGDDCQRVWSDESVIGLDNLRSSNDGLWLAFDVARVDQDVWAVDAFSSALDGAR